MKIINKKIIILGALLSPFLFFNHITSAESYESSVGISFTLNPTINVTVSGDLTIANLTPGDYKDSNSITVTANSNSIAGYTLSSTVGSSTNTSTELRKDGVDTTNKFSSITTNKASLSNFDDSTNTWGYSYCTDTASNCNNDSTKWISGDITGTPATGYNGLPLYTSSSSIKLINSTTSGTSSVLFKIGARTTTNQIAGEYTNVINFIGVANPNPQVKTLDQVTTMQEPFSCILTREGTTNTLTDTRDGNSYTVAKLKDGKCWMTTNLNLAGGTALSADDTDVSSDYISSFITSNNLTKSGNTIVLPASSTSGFDTNNYSYVYNSGRTSTDCSDPGCYSYYSWDAVTLGSGRNISSENTNAPYSVCPKGWRLPISGSSSNYGWKRGDFYGLGKAYGANLENTPTDDSLETGGKFYENAGINTIAGFLLAGFYDNLYSDKPFNNGNHDGLYWTSTSGDNNLRAHVVDITTKIIGIGFVDPRYRGFSVRCLKSS